MVAMADFRSAIAGCRVRCRLRLFPSANQTCGKHKMQAPLFRQYRFKLMSRQNAPISKVD